LPTAALAKRRRIHFDISDDAGIVRYLAFFKAAHRGRAAGAELFARDQGVAGVLAVDDDAHLPFGRQRPGHAGGETQGGVVVDGAGARVAEVLLAAARIRRQCCASSVRAKLRSPSGSAQLPW